MTGSAGFCRETTVVAVTMMMRGRDETTVKRVSFFGARGLGERERQVSWLNSDSGNVGIGTESACNRGSF